MKRKYFDLKLYRSGLRQLRVPGVVLTILSLCCTILPAYFSLQSAKQYNMQYAVYISNISIGSVTVLQALMMLVAPAVLCLTLFSYLNSRKGSDFYHSLPDTRTSLFLSYLAAILTWVIFILVFPLLLTACLFLALGVLVNGAALVLEMLTFLVGAALITAAMLFAMSITGTYLTNITVFGLILFLPRLLSTVFAYVVMNALPILTIRSFGMFGNPNYNIPVKFFLVDVLHMTSMGLDTGDAVYTSVPAILYTLVLALIYLALALLLFCKRKSETAGRSAPNRVLQHVYRCAVTLPITLVIPATLIRPSSDYWGEYGSTVIVCSVVALVIYFLYELITTKKLKNLLTAAPVLLVVALLDVAFIASASALSADALRFKPSADEIAYVTLQPTPNYTIQTQSYNEQALQKLQLADPRLLDSVSTALADTVNTLQSTSTTRTNCVFQIHMKSGKTVERRLKLQDSKISTIRDIITSGTAYRSAMTQLPPESKTRQILVGDLSVQDSQKIWNSFAGEYAKLSDAQKLQLANANLYEYGILENSSGKSQENSAIDSIQVNGSADLYNFANVYSLTVETPETLRLYLRLENAKNKTTLEKIIQLISTGKEKQFSYSVNLMNWENDPDYNQTISKLGDRIDSYGSIACIVRDSNTEISKDNAMYNASAKKMQQVFKILNNQLNDPVDISMPFIQISFSDINSKATCCVYMPLSLENVKAILKLQGIY